MEPPCRQEFSLILTPMGRTDGVKYSDTFPAVNPSSNRKALWFNEARHFQTLFNYLIPWSDLPPWDSEVVIRPYRLSEKQMVAWRTHDGRPPAPAIAHASYAASGLTESVSPSAQCTARHPSLGTLAEATASIATPSTPQPDCTLLGAPGATVTAAYDGHRGERLPDAQKPQVHRPALGTKE